MAMCQAILQAHYRERAEMDTAFWLFLWHLTDYRTTPSQPASITLLPLWTAVISATTAVLTVWLGNWWQGRKQDKDRIFSMRREVYMKASEEIFAITAEFLKITKQNPENTTPLKKFYNALAKVQIVGQTKTQLLAGEVSRKYRLLQTSLVGSYRPGQVFFQRIILVQKHVEAARELVLAASRESVIDPVKIQGLERNFQNATEDLKNEVERYNKSHLEYVKKAMPQLGELRICLVDLQIAMRGELGIRSDSGIMKDAVRQNQELNSQIVNSANKEPSEQPPEEKAP